MSHFPLSAFQTILSSLVFIMWSSGVYAVTVACPAGLGLPPGSSCSCSGTTLISTVPGFGSSSTPNHPSCAGVSGSSGSEIIIIERRVTHDLEKIGNFDIPNVSEWSVADPSSVEGSAKVQIDIPEKAFEKGGVFASKVEAIEIDLEATERKAFQAEMKHFESKLEDLNKTKAKHMEYIDWYTNKIKETKRELKQAKGGFFKRFFAGDETKREIQQLKEELKGYQKDLTKRQAKLDKTQDGISEINRSIAELLEWKLQRLDTPQNQTTEQATTQRLGDVFAQAIFVNDKRYWTRFGYTRSKDEQLGNNTNIKDYDFSVGVDTRLTEATVLGLAAAYSYSDEDGATTQEERHNFRLTPYFSYQFSQKFDMDARFSLSKGWTDIKQGTDSGERDDYGASIIAGLNYEVYSDALWDISSSVNISHGWGRFHGLNQGAISRQKITSNTTVFRFGGNIQRRFEELTVGVAADYNYNKSVTDGIDPNDIYVSVNMAYPISDKGSLSLGLHNLFGREDYDQYGGFIQFSLDF